MFSNLLSKAIQEARNIPYQRKEYRLYAILVDKKGRIIAQGSNSYEKTHPLMKAWAGEAEGNVEKQYLHAEALCCIKSLRSPLKPYKIYVARVNKNGKPCCALPCQTCRMALEKIGVKQIEATL